MTENERKTLLERSMEASKWIDKWGIRVGLAMMAFGIIYNPLLLPGAVVAGSSVVTKWAGERIRKWSEKRRLQGKSNVLYQYKSKSSESLTAA